MSLIVLAVEDDLHEQLMIGRALAEIEGVKLVTVDTGGDALDYIQRRGPYEWRRPNEHPHLVIADHQLPDMLAIDLVRAMRGHASAKLVPVFVYGEELNGMVMDYRAFDVDGPLEKPEDERAFKSAVQEAVKRLVGGSPS